jgi:glycosyltransferase involved in cell wall biosynthesis
MPGAGPLERRLGHLDPGRIGTRLGQRRGELAPAAADVERTIAGADRAAQKRKPPRERRRLELGGQPLPQILVVVPDRATVPRPRFRSAINATSRLAGRLECAHRTSVRDPYDPVNVAFDSRPAKNTHGVGRYARCLLEALRDLDRGRVAETHQPRRCDVYHSPWIDGALLRCPVPMVVTLHDLAPLKRHGQYLRSTLRFKLRYLAVQRAVRVIVPTYAVADDVESVLEIPRNRIAVIPEAPAASLHHRPEEEVRAVRHRFSLPERYLVWVGALQTPDPRKRVAALARAPRSMPLVLVGPTAPWAHQLPDVKLTGAVSDDELAAIYTGAHALIFPSDDEGFGLPPVEALACGTPVAASDVPALREVLDGRATFRPVEDLPGLVAAAEAAERPAPPPPPWSWADAAARTWEVYREAVEAAALGQISQPKHRAAALVKDA